MYGLLGLLATALGVYIAYRLMVVADCQDDAFDAMMFYLDNLEESPQHHYRRNMANEVLESYYLVKLLFKLKAKNYRQMFPDMLDRLDLVVLAAQNENWQSAL